MKEIHKTQRTPKKVSGWILHEVEGLPYVEAGDVAKRLGYHRPRDIYTHIKRLLRNNKLKESGVCVEYPKDGEVGATGKKIYLNQDAAILVVMSLNMDVSPSVATEVIDIYYQYKQGDTITTRKVQLQLNKITQLLDEERSSNSQLENQVLQLEAEKSVLELDAQDSLELATLYEQEKEDALIKYQEASKLAQVQSAELSGWRSKDRLITEKTKEADKRLAEVTRYRDMAKDMMATAKDLSDVARSNAADAQSFKKVLESLGNSEETKKQIAFLEALPKEVFEVEPSPEPDNRKTYKNPVRVGGGKEIKGTVTVVEFLNYKEIDHLSGGYRQGMGRRATHICIKRGIPFLHFTKREKGNSKYPVSVLEEVLISTLAAIQERADNLKV